MGSYLLKLPLSLSVITLLFTYTVYLIQLFTLGDAYVSWMLISVLMSSALLFSSLHPSNWMSKRVVKNTMLIGNSFVVGYGTLLASDMDHPYALILTIIGYLLLAGIIVGMYQTTLVGGLAPNAKVLHVLNITVGIALTLSTLYFLYIYLLFSEDGNGEIWKLFIPLVIYGIIYSVQMKALKVQRKRIAYTVAIIQLLIPAVLFLLWIAVTKEGGL